MERGIVKGSASTFGREAARALVQGARRGDPDAQATLARIGAAARRGSLDAIKAFDHIKRYVERHPVVPVGVTLAHGTMHVTLKQVTSHRAGRAPRRARRVRRAARTARACPGDGEPSPQPRGRAKARPACAAAGP